MSLDLLKLRKFKMEEKAQKKQYIFYFYYKQLDFNIN